MVIRGDVVAQQQLRNLEPGIEAEDQRRLCCLGGGLDSQVQIQVKPSAGIDPYFAFDVLDDRGRHVEGLFMGRQPAGTSLQILDAENDHRGDAQDAETNQRSTVDTTVPSRTPVRPFVQCSRP